MRPSFENLGGLRPWLAGLALAFAASFGGQAVAATSASGQGTGVTADAGVLFPLLSVPLADTERQQASEGTSLQFNESKNVVGIGDNGNLGVLELNVGAVNGTTSGDLRLNKVTSSAGVVSDGNTPGLSIKSIGLLDLLGLSITADAVESAVEASCSATGQPKVTSSVDVANLKVDAFGLGLIDLPVPQDLNKELLNVDLSIPLGITTVKVAELKIISHEQTINAAGEREVNALRVKLKVLDIDLLLLKLTGLNLDLKVGTSYAKLDNCGVPNPGGVQINTNALPDINPDNVTNYPVTGSCTVNSGNNTVIINASNSRGQTAQTTASCDTEGNFASNNFDVSSLDDGSVTITVDQGNATDSADVNKNTVVITLGSLSQITESNQASYPVTGTCWGDGGAISVTAKDKNGQIASATGVLCNSGTYATSGFDVSRLANGSVVITAEHLGGTASGSTTKSVDNGTLALEVLPNIDSDNQGAYVVSGSCSRIDGSVRVTATGQSGSPKTATVNCNSSRFNATLNVTGLPDGQVTIAATQGGITVDRVVSKDTSRLDLSATLPNITKANESAYPVSGTCKNGAGTIAITLTDEDGVKVRGTASCTDGAFSATPDASSLADGDVTVKVEQDQANVSKVVTKDTSGIGLDTNQPPIDDANQHDYPVSGTCKKGAGSVTITFTDKDGRMVSVTTVCNPDGTFYEEVDVHDLGDGEVDIEVEQDGGTDGTSVNKDTGAKPDAIFSDRFEA